MLISDPYHCPPNVNLIDGKCIKFHVGINTAGERTCDVDGLGCSSKYVPAPIRSGCPHCIPCLAGMHCTTSTFLLGVFFFWYAKKGNHKIDHDHAHPRAPTVCFGIFLPGAVFTRTRGV